MSPPQPFSVGVDSDLPLQLSFADLFLEVRHPPALGVEHRDLVLELDQRQPAHTFGANLGQDRSELLARRLQRRRACFQLLDRLAPTEVVHEHEPGREVRVLPARAGEDVAKGARQHIAAGVVEAVDRPLRPPSLLLPLGGYDPPASLQGVDGVVEGAEVQADELVLVAVAHRCRELVGMHGPLVQERKDRQAKARDLRHRLAHIPYGVYPTGYTGPTIPPAPGPPNPPSRSPPRPAT